MHQADCQYCNRGPAMDAVGIEIAKLSSSTLFLFREQSHPGRLIIAHDRHVNEITDLSDQERNNFFADVAKATRVLQALYHPDKINYGAYGDRMPHLHFHLVPKYRDGFEWGDVFAMNPGKKTLTDAEYAAAVDAIRCAL